MLEFRILGGLDVHDDGRRLEFREGNDAALLTLLLLHAGQPVSVDRIVDELWPDDPPASARKIVQNSISRLRRALGEERLETRGHAYVLHAEADEIDAARFERLVTEGRGDDALPLWRGPPLVDAARFEELHLTALEQRLADEVADRRSGVAAELDALVRRHPYRERLRALQMQALYTAGRQADALDAYRAAAHTLRNDLGLEPGEELRALEQAILNQDLEIPRRGASPPRSRRRSRIVLAVGAALIAGGSVAGVVLRGHASGVVMKRNSLVLVDPAGDRLTSVIPLGFTPSAVAAGASGVWVAASLRGTVTHIDPASRAMTTYGINGSTDGMATDGHGVWVVTGSDGRLIRIDNRYGIGRTIQLPSTPTGGAFGVALGDDAVWVAGNEVFRVSAATGAVGPIGSAHGSCCVANVLAVSNGFVWVGEEKETVVRIGERSLRVVGEPQDLGAIQQQMAVGYGAVWVAGVDVSVGPNGTTFLFQLDPNSGAPVTKTRLAGAWATGIAVGAGAVWVTDNYAKALFKVDPKTGRVVASLHLARSPVGVAVIDDRVWVAVD